MSRGVPHVCGQARDVKGQRDLWRELVGTRSAGRMTSKPLPLHDSSIDARRVWAPTCYTATLTERARLEFSRSGSPPCPEPLLPQQRTAPLGTTAHVWYSPAEIELGFVSPVTCVGRAV